MNGFDRRSQAKMEQIEATAQSLFRAKGVAATSVEEIAALAGVSKVSLYRYYGDKQALARKLVFASMERQMEHLQSLMKSDLPFPQKFERMLSARAQTLAGEGGEATGGMLSGGLLSMPDIQAFIAEYNATRITPLLKELVAQGQREKVIAPDIPTDTLLLHLQAMQHLLAAPLTPAQRQDLGRLLLYGFKGHP